MNGLSTQPLPVRLTPFVGRRADLDRMLELIEDPAVRLVTILGSGGIGKTSFAIELARVLKDRFRDGAVFVPLAQLSSIDELLPALAGALRVHLPPGGDVLHSLLDRLAAQQVLLVLDNFEHLLDEAALICDILASGPQVKVLVTSREKLNLGAETLFHLGGLELPLPGELRNVEQYDSLRLFLQKAAQARPGFSLNAEETPAVVRICQLVDGNPLGILMAAGWLEHFSPVEIAREISDGLDFLSCHLRDAEPRHCCMRAVFDSSFNRLDPRLQAVFRKLAVFRGGFDLPAARSVAGADLWSLIALADKSLLSRDPQVGRYQLHELLRQYVDARLAEAGEHEVAVAAYTRYYTALLGQCEGQLISSAQTPALDLIEADLDNIRQAFLTVIAGRDFASARSMLLPLYAFCDMRSRFHEGEAMFREAAHQLAAHAGEPPEGAWAVALLSWFDMRMYIAGLDSYEDVDSQARSCLDQCLLYEDAQGMAASLTLLGAIAEHQARFATAIGYFQQAMKAYPALDAIYWVEMRIGLCYQADRQYSEALQTFLGCLERGRRTGERVKTGWSLQNIGDTLVFQGQLEAAESYLDEALALFQQVGTPIGVLWSLCSLSRVHAGLGRLERARECAVEAAQLADEIHSASWVKKTDEVLQRLGAEPAVVVEAGGQPCDEALSQRELEVLRLLKSELSGPAIAESLVVSLNTVRYHTKNIYRKLGASTRLEALQRAKDLGL